MNKRKETQTLPLGMQLKSRGASAGSLPRLQSHELLESVGPEAFPSPTTRAFHMPWGWKGPYEHQGVCFAACPSQTSTGSDNAAVAKK